MTGTFSPGMPIRTPDGTIATFLDEEWRAIPGYEGAYEVSNQGRVRSLDRHVRAGLGIRVAQGQILSPRPQLNGHLRLALSREGSAEHRFVHHLVLEAFIGPRPDGLWGCHNNGNPKDNRVENLRWDTPSSNAIDRIKHGHHELAERTHCPQGHEYTPENTWVRPGYGHRQCRTCNRDRQRARRMGMKK